jgi:hypothetical protein
VSVADDLGRELDEAQAYVRFLRNVTLPYTEVASPPDVDGVLDEIRWAEIEVEVLRDRIGY